MPGDRPTLHVTNWSSRKLHGSGRKWTIMAAPRAWEHGDGMVINLTPDKGDLDAVRQGFMSFRQYRTACLTLWGYQDDEDLWAFGPGELHAFTGEGDEEAPVADGDTMLCACSRDAAAHGECHRVFAAELLRRAGWRVVLDGRELVGVTAEWEPAFAEAVHGA